MRIVLISHCDLNGNSAMHVFSIAECLRKLGHDVVMLIPAGLETIGGHREPCFPILTYAQAEAANFLFEGSEHADIIHCWTPREHVRQITEKLLAREQCPYIVHMEDNEEKVLQDELKDVSFDELRRLPAFCLDKIIAPHRSHPIKYRNLIREADGYTCLIDKLLEFKPEGLLGHVFWPGFDPEFLPLPARSVELRESLGIDEDEIVVFYSGNVHYSIKDDVRNLYLAVALLRARGRKIRLLRTGWNYAQVDAVSEADIVSSRIELGFVDRAQIPHLLSLSDVLVQPGKSDEFNDYRFPSKLPEYLVSGKPVILPNSNIGSYLRDGVDVLKLYDGTLTELVQRIELVLDDADLARRIGQSGRQFAIESLTWERAANGLVDFYSRVIASSSERPQAIIGSTVSCEDFSSPGLPVKAIAFYLPQFHPIPENDLWWGKGFTEWTNVARARPQFQSHRQPRLPTELGYYDLRVPDVMHAQAALAQEYGIGGFCFYYYWFDRRRLLERPLDMYLNQGPDFPFCICWANENWSRRWDGSANSILVEQNYEDGFEDALIRDLAHILFDERYIRVDGAPLLLIYRVTEFPDPIKSIKNMRNAAQAAGIPRLHIAAVQSFGLEDPRLFGVDSAVEFSPPHTNRLLLKPSLVGGTNENFVGYLEDYVGVASSSINSPPTDYVRYRGCFPMWDNTARRRNAGHVFINESTKGYAYWLRFLVHEALVRRDQVEPMVFINAWNEWAEGTYLEPDEHYGRAFLEVTREALAQGIADFVVGVRNPDREREFVEYVSRLAKDNV